MSGPTSSVARGLSTLDAEAIVGEAVEVLRDAPDAERPVGRLRLIGAVVSLIGALYVVFLTGGGPVSMGFLGVVLVAGAFWWRRFSDVERAHAEGRVRRLVLGKDGVSLAVGDVISAVRWADVKRIELDHDRMLVQLVLSEGTLDLEPPLGGLGLEELGRRVHRRQPLSKAPRGDHDGDLLHGPEKS